MVEVGLGEGGGFDGFDVPSVEVFVGNQAEQLGVVVGGFGKVVFR